ncbi:DUF1801 domain-containing protein [Nocardia sp. CDC159]|uniref:DUF1801 domain-containing protein n=1 Tax=Nocardia pulmonis TaxID=2951408 RepID=A0A9X2EBT2_9NOCA|nr:MULTISPECIES: DUF1801 domain-containing protein [Nocardia]MCM6776565.1 DUF1801 domain-containing protein [Nocardia pulmonis]MCM6788989.1 DUF1801 domain-containing protein [Nocardia sp. CDC159]
MSTNTDSGPRPEQFQELIARFDPRVGEFAVEARALILDVMPRAVELVWPNQGTASYGTGPRKMSEHFCYLSLFPRYLRLGFYYGTELPDPEHLLIDGGGKLMRSMKITNTDQLHRPAVRTLIELATTHRVPPLPRG